MQGQSPAGSSQPQNIVSFGPYHTAMTQPVLAQIRTYWEDLRAGRDMPLRSEIDPRDMSSFLGLCFVLEKSNLGDIRFRLAGMDINALMGMEVRGMPLQSLVKPESRANFADTVKDVFAVPEVQEYKLTSRQQGTPNLKGALLILPLKSEDGNTDRAIGCLSTDGVTGFPPRRFTVTELQRTSLQTGLTQTDLTPEPEQFVEGFAETRAPFDAAPYLRVVK